MGKAVGRSETLGLPQGGIRGDFAGAAALAFYARSGFEKLRGTQSAGDGYTALQTPQAKLNQSGTAWPSVDKA